MSLSEEKVQETSSSASFLDSFSSSVDDFRRVLDAISVIPFAFKILISVSILQLVMVSLILGVLINVQ